MNNPNQWPGSGTSSDPFAQAAAPESRRYPFSAVGEPIGPSKRGSQMEGSPFRNVVQPNNPAMMFLETGLESPLMIDESQPGFSKLARGRAETISYTQTRPFLTDEEASVLNVRELPMRRNMNSAMRHTRNRSETFSGGTANSVLMDPFSPSAFTSGWGDAVRSPTLTNRPMSAQIDPYPVRFGSPSLLTSGFTTNQIHASTVDTVTRTLDYLSLDDGAFDALSRNDPVAHAFHMAGTQRSNGTAQNRGRSMTSALNPGAINTIPFSPATTTMRPRSFTIPARPVYQSSYENENVDFYGATTQSPMMQESPPQMSPGMSDVSMDGTTPSRSLWVGNIDTSLPSKEILAYFSPFGQIESIRMLPEKDCAFINYVNMEDTVAAKEAMQGGHVGNCIVKVGFGKVDSSEGHGPQATKSLWIGNIPASVESADLEKAFSKYGAVESARVLSHKNCGFVNFVRVEDAIEARKNMHGKDLAGAPVKIGFAKVPSAGASPSIQTPMLREDIYSAALPPPARITSLLGTQSYEYEASNDKMYYAPSLLTLPESAADRKVDNTRMREYRKRLESPAISDEQFNEIFNIVLMDAVTASADYIGNVVVQKLMERGSPEQRLALIHSIAHYMASVGVHKNGTWAIQKIIDVANTDAQIQAIIDYVAPFTPALLLDQFGNYVVQCCLRFNNNRNQFIFDAIAAKIVEIGTARFGARATRTCLDSPHTSKRQQKLVAMAIVEKASELCIDPNGALLVGWLLDTSTLPGKYRAMAPIFTDRPAVFCTHKLASSLLLKIVNQKAEVDARESVISSIFFNDDANVLPQILLDSMNGIHFIRRVLLSTSLSAEVQTRLLERIHMASQTHPELHNSQGYRRLLEEFSSSITPLNMPPQVSQEREEEVVSPLAPRSHTFH